MSSSWYLLPNGKLMPLTSTQDLLVELVPVVEDMTVAYQQLLSVVAESVQRLDETRRLLVRSRRQRLDLQLVTKDDSTAESGDMR
jgi:hypothetical protein